MQGRGSAPPFISSLRFAFLLLAISSTPVLAVNHAVSWTLGPTYDSSGQSFSAGDTITFTWSGNHDVVLVSATEYSDCTSSSGDQRYASSPAVVTLTAAGTSYYMICSVSGHCTGGMKYKATTLAAASNSTSPTTPTPPSSTSSPSGNTAHILAFSPFVTFISLILISLSFVLFA